MPKKSVKNAESIRGRRFIARNGGRFSMKTGSHACFLPLGEEEGSKRGFVELDVLARNIRVMFLTEFGLSYCINEVS
jgi:hypothetical protein